MARAAKWITANHDLGNRLSPSETNSPRPRNNVRRDRSRHKNPRRRTRSGICHGCYATRTRHPVASSGWSRRQADHSRALRFAPAKAARKRRRRNRGSPNKLQAILLEAQASEAAKAVGPALYGRSLPAGILAGLFVHNPATTTASMVKTLSAQVL